MCNFLSYYYTCGYHGTGRFRTAECPHASDLTRCRDTDRTVVLPYCCKYCAIGQRRRSHPGRTLLPTPPPSPGSEDEQDIVWIVQSRCELFHRQPGFRCYDPFEADREKLAEKQARVKRLKLQPAKRAEPIALDDEMVDSPMTKSSDEDPFGPEDVRPRFDRKWSLSFLRQKTKKPIETSRCCMEMTEPAYGMPGYIADDRCESTI
jgi:hypothetical protein